MLGLALFQDVTLVKGAFAVGKAAKVAAGTLTRHVARRIGQEELKAGANFGVGAAANGPPDGFMDWFTSQLPIVNSSEALANALVACRH